MNADETPLKTNVRLQRIKVVSRIIRYFCLAFFAIAVGQWLWFSLLLPLHSSVHGYLMHTLMMVPMEAVLCFWYWKLAQLFRLYEQGLTFASATIRCIKILGFLCVINWALSSIWSMLSDLFPPPPSPALPPGATVKIVESSFHIGFFSFSYAGINLGILLAGIVIVLIAWIMDEGRKIQEEQELTV